MEKSFAETIRELILSSKISVPTWVKILEIPRATLQSWEYGTRVPPKYLQKAVIQEMKRIIKESENKKILPKNTENETHNVW